jgi:HEPN domain-containing protein
MDEAKRELVQSWLIRAQRDLATARKLVVGSDPYLDTASYHRQQSAEKAVKGFLVYNDQRVDKTHDVERLITAAIPYDAQFSSWVAAGARLTPYATEYRYPGGAVEPDQNEFDQAMQDTEALYNFVLSLLPAEVHP